MTIRQSPHTVRTNMLFESSYLRPEENPRVVQDNDPVKAITLAKATERHRSKV